MCIRDSRLRAVPLNITVVQAYAPTSDYDDSEIVEFHDQLHNVIDQTSKKYILVLQGDRNAKMGQDAHENWQGICGPFCNEETEERGLQLLEFATFNNSVLANAFTITKHPEDGAGIAKVDTTTTRLITF